MEPYVVVVTGPTGDRSVIACSGTALVGRTDTATIPLHDPRVSRRHLEIDPLPAGEFRIRDLGSRNGTTVDGQRIRSAECTAMAGAALDVGPYTLTLAGRQDDEALTELSDGGYRVLLDDDTRTVVVDGRPVPGRVSPQVYLLLSVLRRESKLVTNAALGDAVYGPGLWDSYMLHNLVRRTRIKLRESGTPGVELLLTVPGVGYRLA